MRALQSWVYFACTSALCHTLKFRARGERRNFIQLKRSVVRWVAVSVLHVDSAGVILH